MSVGGAPFSSRSLNAATYDLGIGRGGRDLGDDVALYLGVVRGAGGRVLELGCGTGRVTIALAMAGCHATGLDLSAAMLAEADQRRDALNGDVRDRLCFIPGDMADFALDQAFDAVIILFRSFMCLLDVTDQRRCLGRIPEHLRPGGVVALALFDPRLDLYVPGAFEPRSDSGIDPRTGHTIVVDVLTRTNDPFTQVLRETWRFTELDAAGMTLRSEEETLSMRWTYRHEMHHLSELSGFEVVGEDSDVDLSPPTYGREQVWLARRA